MTGRERSEERPTHSVDPGKDRERPGEGHEVDAPDERADDEAGGEDGKTTRRTE